jgi:hypothetical protein
MVPSNERKIEKEKRFAEQFYIKRSDTTAGMP